MNRVNVVPHMRPSSEVFLAQAAAEWLLTCKQNLEKKLKRAVSQENAL